MPSAIKVNFDIGHVASARVEPSPEGYTHDWEIFVRGPNGADISHFIEKVVFQLHATFKKPRRVVKKPPFSVKESGYGGFTLPIEIYLKNKSKPKKIQFYYDFTMHDYGILKDRYIFDKPSEEFRKKLLMGGGVPVTNKVYYYTNPDHQNKLPVRKPKMSPNTNTKHKSTVHKDTTQIQPAKSPQSKNNNETGILGSETIQKHEHQQEEAKKKSTKRQQSNETTTSSDNRKKKSVASPLKRVNSPSISKDEVEEKFSETNVPGTSKSDVVSLTFEFSDTGYSDTSGFTSAGTKFDPDCLPSYVSLVDLTSNYMVRLSNLKQRINEMLANSENEKEIRDIVLESGRYVNTDTADYEFDLGLLDSYTVQRLIQLVNSKTT